MNDARTAFAELRAGTGIIAQPVIFNPLTARIAQAHRT